MSLFATMATVPVALSPALALKVMPLSAVRLVVPTTVEAAVLKSIALVLTLRLPPIPEPLVPLKEVVPLPVVCVTLPVVRIVDENVALPALLTANDDRGVDPPMVPLTDTLPPPAANVAPNPPLSAPVI